MSDPIWFYWGGKALSFLRWSTLVSVGLYHDDVRLVVRRGKSPRAASKWSGIDQDFHHPNTTVDYYDRLKDVPGGVTVIEIDEIAPAIANLRAPDVHTSDLLSWHILSAYGGTVADMDIVFHGPVPEVERDVQVVCFTKFSQVGYVPVGFMQGRPCDLWREMLGRAAAAYDPNFYESCGSTCIQPSVRGTLPETIVFPWAGRYAWDEWHEFMFGSPTWPTIPPEPECCGIHWYGGHNQEWNRQIKCAADLPCGAIGAAVKETLKRARIRS